MWHLKTTTVPVIEGTLGMIKKGTDNLINLATLANMELKKMLFAELLISLKDC